MWAGTYCQCALTLMGWGYFMKTWTNGGGEKESQNFVDVDK